MYVSDFDDYISGKVVGKNISALTSLSRVGGASLTTEGFDQLFKQLPRRPRPKWRSGHLRRWGRSGG